MSSINNEEASFVPLQNEGTQTNVVQPNVESNFVQYSPNYPYSPFIAGGGMQPVVYVSQFQPMISETETDSFVQKQQGACEKGWGGCKWRKADSCCKYDDGRALGSFQNFIVGVLFGSVSPVLSTIMMYGMETSKLSRIGVQFGTANVFLIISACLLCYPQHFGLFSIFFTFILGLLILICALKSFRQFLYTYSIRQNKTEEELVKVVSQTGTCCEFAGTFFVSLVFPIIGTLVSIIVKRNSLLGRYGALSGLGFLFVVIGIFSSFSGHPPALLFFGLLVMEISLVHFRRALICAEIPKTSTTTA